MQRGGRHCSHLQHLLHHKLAQHKPFNLHIHISDLYVPIYYSTQQWATPMTIMPMTAVGKQTAYQLLKPELELEQDCDRK